MKEFLLRAWQELIKSPVAVLHADETIRYPTVPSDQKLVIWQPKTFDRLYEQVAPFLEDKPFVGVQFEKKDAVLYVRPLEFCSSNLEFIV